MKTEKALLFLSHGVVLYKLGLHAEAMHSMEYSRGVQPLPEAYQHKARALCAQGEPAAASHVLEEALEKFKSHKDHKGSALRSHSLLGDVHIQQAEAEAEPGGGAAVAFVEAADGQYTHGLRRGAGDPHCLKKRAATRLRLGRGKEAAADYLALLAGGHASPDVLGDMVRAPLHVLSPD